MRRILVVGSSGAGKSTLAGELARRLDPPLIHLDRHYRRPGRVAPTGDEFRAEVTALAARPAWVMDGNHAGTLDLLSYIWRYPRRSRPRVLAAVAGYAPTLPVCRLRGRRDVAHFLEGWGKQP
ncbi:adenylate kinase [Micromonospora sp. NPDC049282]|uniref:adenylate kinase n=1 Tax=Micromonospora sp. NPDC049282 TaxID=3364269 RepID=UPI00371139E7